MQTLDVYLDEKKLHINSIVQIKTYNNLIVFGRWMNPILLQHTTTTFYYYNKIHNLSIL